MKEKILIFTATYNEAQNIGLFLNLIDKLDIEKDILIIDDNSPDGTAEKIKEFSKNKNNIHLKIRAKKLGLDSAHKLGFKYAKEKKYDYLITMDSDLSHDPLIIPSFINELKNKEFVIGSRYMEGGKCGMVGLRLLLSYCANKFIKYIFKINCNEFTTSYRGFNLKKLKDFDLNEVHSGGYSFFMDTIYQLDKRGFFIKEIPIHFKDRIKGTSKISKIEIFRTFYNIFKIKLREIF
tara:strand:- start:850 stop:1557 length:708 start_codon:yes stop_codon:yes gene_type:complete